MKGLSRPPDVKCDLTEGDGYLCHTVLFLRSTSNIKWYMNVIRLHISPVSAVQSRFHILRTGEFSGSFSFSLSNFPAWRV